MNRLSGPLIRITHTAARPKPEAGAKMVSSERMCMNLMRQNRT